MTSTLILTCSCGASMTYAGASPQRSRDAFLAAHESCRKALDSVGHEVGNRPASAREIERSLRTLPGWRSSGDRPLGLT